MMVIPVQMASAVGLVLESPAAAEAALESADGLNQLLVQRTVTQMLFQLRTKPP
jgi:hypothetical protein